MAFPWESAEQRRGVIPRRVRVVARSCGVRALNAHVREQERWRRAREGPRVRRTSPEGVSSPRARRTPPEGASNPRARRTLPEGASSPRARRTPPEGAFSPRVRWTPPEGAFSPLARWTSPEGPLSLERGGPRPRGHSVVLPWRAAGATRVVIVSHTCFRFVS
jgi:hypothetical protein